MGYLLGLAAIKATYFVEEKLESTAVIDSPYILRQKRDDQNHWFTMGASACIIVHQPAGISH